MESAGWVCAIMLLPHTHSAHPLRISTQPTRPHHGKLHTLWVLAKITIFEITFSPAHTDR